jgi:hypothetical protein
VSAFAALIRADGLEVALGFEHGIVPASAASQKK